MYGINLSKPKKVQTKNGPRYLSKGKAGGVFWDAWRANKTALKEAGWSVSKNPKTGDWEVCLWEEVSKEELKIENERIEASRAVAADPDFQVPVPEGKELYPYQVAGIQFALNTPTGSCLIADEMGLGKTIQAIGVMNVDELKRVLIICPASLKINWNREMSQWLTYDVSVGIAAGSDWPDTDVVIVNYDILTRFTREIEAVDWDLLIVDECQKIKNPKAQRSEATYAIKAKRRLFLTGTPIVNRPIELWPIVSSLDPNEYSFWNFVKRYCAAFQGKWGWDMTGASNLEELQQRLRSRIMVRRLKADVLTELPPKLRQVIELPTNGCVGAVRDEMDALEEWQAEIDALRAAVELSKASDNPEDYAEAVRRLKEGIQAVFEEISRLRHATAVAKIPYVIEHVENVLAGESKVLVFAHHRDVLEALKKKFGNQAVLVYGGTSMLKRDAAVQAFQNDPKVRVFIGSIQAAGVGLTLTAASHVIFAELDWVPGNVTQAEDRAHRIGSEIHDSILVQHLVFDGSLDCNMANTLVAKQAVIDAALDKDVDLIKSEPLFPTKSAATANLTPAQLEKDAIPIEQVKAVHNGLKILAGLDPDRASVLNGVGFNGVDGNIGHNLANWEGTLTPKQATIGLKLMNKYRRQIWEFAPDVAEMLELKGGV